MVLFVKDKTLVAIRSKVQFIVVTCAPNHGTIVLWMNSLGPCAMSLHHRVTIALYLYAWTIYDLC